MLTFCIVPTGIIDRYYSEALNLVLNCLKFDFVGIFPDESTDDIGTVQVPASWRQLFEEGNLVQMFWTLYGSLTGSNQTKVIILFLPNHTHCNT
mgnify:CR=1 FL=1